ncbi:MAG TPA: methyltransferase domain-containing protein, partial [Acidimicrobiia bacterium]|nr:methyltransferase domain-containing protein [Acidimicrobiia bacterium]
MRAVAYLDQRDDRGESDDGYSLDQERRLITIAASRHGYEMARVYEASAGASRDDALAAVGRGDARALVATRACDLCADRDELAALLARSAAEGWELIVLDVGLDTSRTEGRAQAQATGGQAADGPELPCLPPPDLRLRVTGVESADNFAFSGWVHLNTYEELLQRHGLALSDFRSILDFGGGPGRIARGLRMRTAASVALCDIDEPAVAWVADHLTGVDARVSTELPPLPFDAGQFELVLCFSVFTHLDAAHQDA